MPSESLVIAEFGLDFLECRLAQIAEVQELLLAAAHEITHCRDSFAFEAVRRTHGQVKFSQAHIELVTQQFVGTERGTGIS